MCHNPAKKRFCTPDLKLENKQKTTLPKYSGKILPVQSCSGPVLVSIGVMFQGFKMPCHHQKEEVLFQPKNRGGLNGFSFEV